MKLCPQCKSSYTDDTLAYCLQDGAALVHLSDESSSNPSYNTDKTLVMGDENITHDPRKMPTDVMETSETKEHRIRPLTNRNDSIEAPKQNTALIIVLTALVTVILGVLTIGGLWFIFKDGTTQAGLDANENNSNNLNQNKNQNGNPNNSNNSNNSNNNNSNTTPTPTPKSIDNAAIREEVMSTLNSWTSAARAHNLETQLKFYADPVSPYYLASSYSLSKIRAERERVYATYDTIDVDLTNIKITPDSSGEKATAVFDKTWVFQGSTKRSSGSVQQKLWLAKIGGRWLISGEKDLKVYYVNKE